MNLFFKDLFEYRHHFNQKTQELFVANSGRVSEKSLQLYSHILNAQRIWNNRIDPKDITFGVWELHPISQFEKIENVNFNHSLLIVDNFDLNDVIAYKNTAGQAFTNTVQNILFQVVNHSTYHTAQIATEFKKSGIEPLATDYIMYKR